MGGSNVKTTDAIIPLLVGVPFIALNRVIKPKHL